MKKKIPSSVLDALIDKDIISEAEQNDLEFGRALKGISPEQLEAILEKEAAVPGHAVIANKNCHIMEEPLCLRSKAAIPNAGAEAGNAKLIRVSNQFRKIVFERWIWAASVAALLILSFPIMNHLLTTSKNEGILYGKCEMVYAYNINEISNLAVGVKGGDLQEVPDITNLSKAKLERELPGLVKIFSDSEELQDIDINGRILAMAYLKLDDAGKAKETLTNMVSRLSAEAEDYEETIAWCNKIISQLQ